MALDLSIDRASNAYMDFVVGLKSLSGQTLNKNVQEIFKQKAAEYSAQTGHAPQTIAEVAQLVDPLLACQTSRFLSRKAQEMMWDGIEDAYKDRAPALLTELNTPEATPLGTLKLEADLPLPAYYTKHEFHIQPGSYYSNDMAAITYNLGQAIYGLRSNQKSKNMEALARACPPPPTTDPKQVRILVMGCAFGTPVWPFCDLYPEAEIHGIDLAAAQLKLAHKKAEMLGKKVHFSQQNAESTRFASHSFDIILTNILLHELDKPAIRNVVNEAYRLLKPGGHYVNSDIAPYRELTPYQQFITDWQVEHNGEPFWRSTLQETYLPGIFEQAGFATVEEKTLGTGGPAPKFPWLTIGKK